MTDAFQLAIKYLENLLPAKIINHNNELKDCVVIKCTAVHSNDYNGFLSDVFQVNLELEDKVAGGRQSLSLIAKVLKDIPGEFRELAQLDTMTFNELSFYERILPVFTNLFEQSGAKLDITPKFYYGFYGVDKELANTDDRTGVFVFENLTAGGYRMGPRDKLDEKHIMWMTATIAQYHATSYALKITNRGKVDEFVKSFKPFIFTSKDKTMFDAMYDITLDRLFRHVKSTKQDDEYAAAIEKLCVKYADRPSRLMNEFLDDDPVFNTIIHGDFNRNNVMFKYDSPEGFEDPVAVKMFDFQWIRYASPVLDLSFYMYMNIDPEILEESWSKILKFYFDVLLCNISHILKCSEDDERLKEFTFENFLNHFSKFAFYGCLVSAWFLPSMLADIAEIKKIEEELNKDLFSEAAKEACMPVGASGLKAMQRVNDNVMHAFKNGYISRLLK